MVHVPTNSLFYPGNVARVRADFVNSGGTAIDPSSIFVAFHHNGNTTSLDASSVINPETGGFYFDLHINSPGDHIFRFTGLGNGKAQHFGTVYVTSANF